MSSFLLKKKHVREALLFCFNFEEIGCRIASNACGGLWRQCFIGNNVQRMVANDDNFDLSDKKRENRPRKVEDCQLQALLNEDDIQSQKMLAEQLGVSQAAISMRLHAMGKVQKIGKWVPHELNDRQMERRQNMPNSACQTKKKASFLHRIVTDDEKWIYFQNPKRKKSWIDPV